MSTPKVSVLMPAYNRANYIGQAIQSVLNQTYHDLELVVVDDGSTDNTTEVIQRFTDPRICYIYQENKGISGALNTAFRASQGEYIALIGSDDVWLPDLLMTLVPVLDQQPEIGLVYARAQAIDSKGSLMPQLQGYAERFPGQWLRTLVCGTYVCGISAVFRRKLIEAVGLWDEDLVASEDWDMWLRMSRVTNFMFIDKVVAYYRIHPGNICSGHSFIMDRWPKSHIRVLDKVFSDPNLPEDVKSLRWLAYRNAYVDIGLRFRAAGNHEKARFYFQKAIEASGDPLGTWFRIAFLIVFWRFISRHYITNFLMNEAIKIRRWMRWFLARVTS